MANSKQDKEQLREKIILEMRRIVEEYGLSTISRSQFKKFSKIKLGQLDKVFTTWNEAVKAAGFQPDVRSRIPEGELLEEFLRVYQELGKIPTVIEFDQISKFSSDTYRKGRHWGNWANVLIAFRKWLEAKHPNSEFLSMLEGKPEITQPIKTVEQKPGTDFVWVGRKGVVYGPPLDFRGLSHEPINEQGVVFFGGRSAKNWVLLSKLLKPNTPIATENVWSKKTGTFGKPYLSNSNIGPVISSGTAMTLINVMLSSVGFTIGRIAL